MDQLRPRGSGDAAHGDPARAGVAHTLLDERSCPDFRDVFGALASASTVIRTAVTRVRLTTVDLRPAELAGVEHFRVLVAELNAARLLAEARAVQVDRRRTRNLELLLDMLGERRLAVRCSPLAGWSPDFSVFSGPGRVPSVVVGTHWFSRPYPHPGPALAALYTGEAALLAERRHRELWDRAHDVGPAVRDILEPARRR